MVRAGRWSRPVSLCVARGAHVCRSHNPVATFSLCLLAQAYELASALVFQM